MSETKLKFPDCDQVACQCGHMPVDHHYAGGYANGNFRGRCTKCGECECWRAPADVAYWRQVSEWRQGSNHLSTTLLTAFQLVCNGELIGEVHGCEARPVSAWKTTTRGMQLGPYITANHAQRAIELRYRANSDEFELAVTTLETLASDEFWATTPEPQLAAIKLSQDALKGIG